MAMANADSKRLRSLIQKIEKALEILCMWCLQLVIFFKDKRQVYWVDLCNLGVTLGINCSGKSVFLKIYVKGSSHRS